MYFYTFNELTQYLEQKRVLFGIELGLARIQLAAKQLGNPEQQLKIIHFAGSNGKGSTLHYTKEMLIAQGYSVASFTTPAQNAVYDQISMNDQTMTEDDFVAIANDVIAVIGSDNLLTEFELITLFAFQHFANCQPDFVLLEVGMGGQLDATNIVTPLISVITSISLEHTAFLGDTIQEIAMHKAGIMKRNVPVVIGEVTDDVQTIFTGIAKKLHCETYFYGEEFRAELLSTPEMVGESFLFHHRDGSVLPLQIRMLGEHQVHNAAIAVMVCKLLAVSEQAIRRGLLLAHWPGRFEVISTNPLVMIDGAHNPAAIKTFIQTLCRKFANYRYKIVFTCFHDKDAVAMLSCLDAVADELVITEMAHERSSKAVDLYELSQSKHKRIVTNLADVVTMEIKDNELLAIVGSLQLLQEFRRICLNIF